jgi:hypothetical protein
MEKAGTIRFFVVSSHFSKVSKGVAPPKMYNDLGYYSTTNLLQIAM